MADEYGFPNTEEEFNGTIITLMMSSQKSFDAVMPQIAPILPRSSRVVLGQARALCGKSTTKN